MKPYFPVEELKKENALLKSKRKEPSNVIERGTLQVRT